MDKLAHEQDPDRDVERACHAHEQEPDRDVERACHADDVDEDRNLVKEKWGAKKWWLTLSVVVLAGVMERFDEQLLPSSYSYVSRSFAATPRELGQISQSRASVQCVFSIAGGFAGYYFSRPWVLVLGCTIWATMTLCFSQATRIEQGYAIWAVNGIGLSFVVPTTQSLIADTVCEKNRGKAFGWLYSVGAVGAIGASFFATNMGKVTIGSMQGWRFAFIVVSLLSYGIALLALIFTNDPLTESKAQLFQTGALDKKAKDVWKAVGRMCKVKTFLFIVFQGVVGAMPWSAVSWLTLYLQTIGMGSWPASTVIALFLTGTVFGGLLGGYLGDLAAKRFPNKGRIAVCQFSVGIGVPLTVVALKWMPKNGSDPHVQSAYVGLWFAMGLLVSWAAPSCNQPIFSEIVTKGFRSMIYAFDRCFESAIAAQITPIVGLIAQKAYHFEGSASPLDNSNPQRNAHNAQALANAMLWCMTLPWGLCLFIYTALYRTYPKDRERARQMTTGMGLNDETEHLVK